MSAHQDSAALADAICGCADRNQHRRDIALVEAFRAAAVADLQGQRDELLEALEQFSTEQTGVSVTNRNVRDDVTIPLDVTMGELRKVEAAIARAKS